MALLLALFLFPDFVIAETIDTNSYEEKNISEKISTEESSKIFFLKEIPRIKVSNEEKSSLSNKDPFLPFGNNNSQDKSGIIFSEIDLKGIASINGDNVAFIKTSIGTNPYQKGDIIGAGFKLLNIDEKNLTIEISNNLTIHSIRLEDEK